MPDAPSSKRLVSYRLSLVLVIPLLVVLTGALIAGVSYFSTRSSIRKLADSLFTDVADKTAEQANAYVRQAAPVVDVLAAGMADEYSASSSDDLARHFLHALRANPGFSWVSYGDEHGNFTGVHRTPGGQLIVNQSHIADGKTALVEREVAADGSWTPHRTVDDTGYDPRTRPFYTRAVAAKKRIWIEPYVFFDEGVPGITCAAPVFGKDGALQGVVTVDFDLNRLSTFVAGLHTSEHTRVFIYTDTGAILAHPTARIVATSGTKGDGKLITKDDIADDIVRQYFHAGAASAFDHDGDRYLAATRAFEPDPSLHWFVAAVAPEGDFMGELARTTRIVLVISLIVVMLAVAFAIRFARRLAKPLVHLAGEMDKVGRFDLGGTDPAPSRYQEIELMNNALATMRKGLASFAVYVPRDLVRAVLASGQRAELGGKPKQMTIFFSDLAGFTSLSEKLQPAALVELLAGYFDEMSKVIAGQRGTIDKFIGDAIMAFWNAPMDEADHAVLACAAALACQAKLAELKQKDPALAHVSARIGLATGDVVVGNIGSHDRMNYTVMGDTVNLASRIEALNKAYGTPILVSEACHAAAGARVVMRAVDVVAVKGKQEGVKVYEPLALADSADATTKNLADLCARAMDAYLARTFSDAAALYEQVLALRPGDGAAEKLRDRCRDYARTPPPAEWSGAYVMTEK